MKTGKDKLELFVFDLDGTLVESHITIYKAMMKSFDKLNIHADLPLTKFNSVIGLHFVDIFDRFNIDVPDFNIFIEIYKQLYFVYIDESTPYKGTEETLSFIKSKYLKTALLTTKVQDQADKIIDHFYYRKYFDYVAGRRAGIKNKPDPEPLLNICKSLNVLPENTIMIGDSEMDIRCGKNAGAKTCAVTFGYRSRAQLESEKPDYMIDQLIELIKLAEVNGVSYEH